MNKHQLAAVAGAVLVTPVASLPVGTSAHADDVAYLVNVTVRPGYHFASAEDALNYGHGVCHKLEAGESFGDILSDIETDRGFVDDNQAIYLVGQSANELCPAMIWALRHSAAGYQGTALTPNALPPQGQR